MFKVSTLFLHSSTKTLCPSVYNLIKLNNAINIKLSLQWLSARHEDINIYDPDGETADLND